MPTESSSFPNRYKLLFFIALLPFGSGFSYDIAGSIGSGSGATLQTRFNDQHCIPHQQNSNNYNNNNVTTICVPDQTYYTHATNQALYFCYSGPNLFGSIIAGNIIDSSIGLRRASILFSFIGTLGTVLFLLGSHFINLPLLIASRWPIGFGNEALVVCMGAFIAKHWKAGKLNGMALAFGFSQLTQRVAGSLNFFLSPRLAADYGLDYALLGGIIANIISFFGVLLVLFFDARYSDDLNLKPRVTLPAADTNKNNSDEEKKKKGPCIDCSSFKQTCCSQTGLTPKFWVLMVVCCSVYCVIFPFVGIAKNLFESTLTLSTIKASEAMSLYQILLAIGQPFVGYLIDKIGRLSLVLLFSTVTSLVGVILGLNLKNTFGDGSDGEAVAGSIVLCLIFACSFVAAAATTRASVPLAIGSPKLTGRSFGVFASLIGGTTSVMRLVSGAILDGHDSYDDDGSHHHNNSMTSYNTTSPSSSLPSPKDFENLFFVFLGLSCVGVVAAIALNVVDTGACPCEVCQMSETATHVLIQSAASRKRRIAEQKKILSEQQQKAKTESKLDGGDGSLNKQTVSILSKRREGILTDGYSRKYAAIGSMDEGASFIFKNDKDVDPDDDANNNFENENDEDEANRNSGEQAENDDENQHLLTPIVSAQNYNSAVDEKEDYKTMN